MFISYKLCKYYERCVNPVSYKYILKYLDVIERKMLRYPLKKGHTLNGTKAKGGPRRRCHSFKSSLPKITISLSSNNKDKELVN